LVDLVAVCAAAAFSAQAFAFILNLDIVAWDGPAPAAFFAATAFAAAGCFLSEAAGMELFFAGFDFPVKGTWSCHRTVIAVDGMPHTAP